MKLELKHLAPYLPYGLKISNDNISTKSKDILLKALTKEKEHHYYATLVCNGDLKCCNSCNSETEKTREIYAQIWTIKPILRPLSDLLKNEFENVYKNQIDYESIEHLSELDCESFLTCNFSYEFWQSLFKNHFDVFGLIEKGLAIDINTIKK
tara:strand:- start:16650 stop:17108 length:459 start_codon:yes stop_codon:yes gene_type:complete